MYQIKFYKGIGRKDKAWHLIAVALGVEVEYIRFRISRDLVISREYGWLATHVALPYRVRWNQALRDH